MGVTKKEATMSEYRRIGRPFFAISIVIGFIFLNRWFYSMDFAWLGYLAANGFVFFALCVYATTVVSGDCSEESYRQEREFLRERDQ